MPITYSSTIAGLPPAILSFYEVVVAAYGRNGTLIKYMLDFYSATTFNFAIDLIYSEARQNFYITTYYNNYLTFAQITAGTLNSTILLQSTTIAGTTFAVTSNDLVIAGKVMANVFAPTYYGNGDLFGARYSLDNMSFIASF